MHFVDSFIDVPVTTEPILVIQPVLNSNQPFFSTVINHGLIQSWYGIFMMREIEALFPEVKFFTLDTPAWNIRTNAFYTRLGYSEVKRDDEFIYYSKKR